MADLRDALKQRLQLFRSLDDRIVAENATLAELRKERKAVETDLAAILAKPEFQAFEKIESSEDGSVVRILRPGTWNKGWSMSKGDLKAGLDEYCEQGIADAIFQFLVERQKPKQVATDFGFERSFPAIKKRKLGEE